MNKVAGNTSNLMLKFGQSLVVLHFQIPFVLSHCGVMPGVRDCAVSVRLFIVRGLLDRRAAPASVLTETPAPEQSLPSAAMGR